MLRPQRPHAGRRERRGTRAGRGGARRAPLPEGQAGAAVDVHRRHRRDGVRHAAGAVPGARGPAVPPRPRGGRLAVLRGRVRARSSARSRSGWVRRVRRTGSRSSSRSSVWGAAIAAFGLVGDHLGLALVVPRGRGRRRRDLRGVPQHDATTHRPGRAARPPRARSTSSSSRADRARRLRRRVGRERVHADGLGRVRWIVVPRGRRRDRGVVPRFARWRVGDPRRDASRDRSSAD